MTDQEEPTSPLEDPRIQFFLRNEQQIREWAALATELFDAVESTLGQLWLDLRDEERVRHLNIRVGERVNGETVRGPALSRDNWCISDPESPDVAVAMGWDGRVDPAGLWPKSSLPYVGVNTAHGTQPGRDIAARLGALAAGRLSASATQPAFKKGSHWTAYRFVRSDPNWWQDLPAWRTRLADELIATWERWVDDVDRAIL